MARLTGSGEVSPSVARSVAQLVRAAEQGEAGAWDELVGRYAGLVLSVCRRYRLRDSDAADVSQTVWLRLVEQLPKLREPAALPGWLATTTSRECLRVQRAGRWQSWTPLDADSTVADPVEVDGLVLAAELQAALRAAFAELPERCQRLLSLLLDGTSSYSEISASLDMPVGSIGPTRARCLHRLRHCPRLAALLPHGDRERMGIPLTPARRSR